MIIGGLGLAYVGAALFRGDVSMTGGLVMVAGAALALLGFVDDLLKVRRQRSLGPGEDGEDRRPGGGGRCCSRSG